MYCWVQYCVQGETGSVFCFWRVMVNETMPIHLNQSLTFQYTLLHQHMGITCTSLGIILCIYSIMSQKYNEHHLSMSSPWSENSQVQKNSLPTQQPLFLHLPGMLHPAVNAKTTLFKQKLKSTDSKYIMLRSLSTHPGHWRRDFKT